MKYEGMIMWLERLKDKLLMSTDNAMTDVIDDAISVIKLHSPERPVIIRTPIGGTIICPKCGETIYHSDMMCRNCTQVIDWGDDDDE